MYTTYNRTIDGLTEKSDRTRGVVEKREKKAESLRNLMASYEIALGEHEDFVANRKIKLAAEQKVLDAMKGMTERLNEELAKEGKSHAEGGVMGEDGIPEYYKRDSGLVSEWEDLVRDFNRIHQGHGGELLKNV